MKDSIIEKIRKAIAKAESVKAMGNMEEYGVLMQVIQKILNKHKLQMSEIPTEEQPDDKIIEDHYILNTSSKTDGKWQSALAGVIARYHFCDIINYTYPQPHFCFIGSKQDVEITCYLYSLSRNIITQQQKVCRRNYVKSIQEGLMEEFTNLKRPSEKELEKSGLIDKRNSYKRAFYSSAVRGLMDKLYDERNRFKDNSKFTALVKTNEVALKDYIKENMSVSTSKVKHNKNSKAGMQDGYRTGKNIEFNKGIATDSDGVKRKMSLLN